MLALLGLWTALAHADDKWVRLQSEHFEVFSDAGAGAGREALRRFEQIRHLFETRTGRTNLTPLPVRVFVFRSGSDFQPYQVNRDAVGYYQSGTDRDYIAMQVEGADLYRVVYHEYTHLLLKHAGYRVPVWFNEGVAELFSTAEVGRTEVRVGDLIPAHVLTLREAELLDLPTLTSVDVDSPYYNERGKSGIFYAESWALTHMLNFSPDYRPGVGNFMRMILNGEDAVLSFRQAFGKAPAVVIGDLKAYLANGRFEGLRFRASRFDVTKVPSTPVSPQDAQLALAELLATIGRTNEARLAYGKLETAYPEDRDVLLALGQFSMRMEDFLSSRRFLERAIRTDDSSARLFYDYAIVLRHLMEPEALVIENLARAVTLDNGFFEAHNFLGHLHLQSERYPEAVGHLKSAAQLQPARVSVWENLAVAYHRAGNKEQARAAAKNARRVVSGSEETARIDALLDLIESDVDKIVQSPVAASRAVAQRPNTVRVQGMLSQVDCLGTQARLHISTAEERVLLLIRGASARVVGTGSSDAQLNCGESGPKPVIVEYRPGVHRTYGTAGEITSIEFR